MYALEAKRAMERAGSDARQAWAARAELEQVAEQARVASEAVAELRGELSELSSEAGSL